MRLRKLAVSVGSSPVVRAGHVCPRGRGDLFGTIALDRAFDYQAIPAGAGRSTDLCDCNPEHDRGLDGEPCGARADYHDGRRPAGDGAVLTPHRAADPSRQAQPVRDRAFVATFVHAVLTLREVVDLGDGTGQVPGIAVATSYLLLASIAALVIYVHHIGQSLRVSALIELVGHDTRKLVDRRYPDAGRPPPVDPEAPRVVAAEKSGVDDDRDARACR